jgi:hypothetical protein
VNLHDVLRRLATTVIVVPVRGATYIGNNLVIVFAGNGKRSLGHVLRNHAGCHGITEASGVASGARGIACAWAGIAWIHAAAETSAVASEQALVSST